MQLPKEVPASSLPAQGGQEQVLHQKQWTVEVSNPMPLAPQ